MRNEDTRSMLVIFFCFNKENIRLGGKAKRSMIYHVGECGLQRRFPVICTNLFFINPPHSGARPSSTKAVHAPFTFKGWIQESRPLDNFLQPIIQFLDPVHTRFPHAMHSLLCIRYRIRFEYHIRIFMRNMPIVYT